MELNLTFQISAYYIIKILLIFWAFLLIACGTDKNPQNSFSEYIDNWYQNFAYHENYQVPDLKTSIDFERYITKPVGELVSLDQEIWNFGIKSKMENGKLEINDFAYTDYIAISNEYMELQLQVLVNWIGASTIASKGLSISIIERDENYEWVNTKIIPSGSGGPIIPSQFLKEEKIFVESPIILSEKTKYIQIEIKNTSSATFLLEHFSVSAFAMISFEDGSIAKPILIQQASLPDQLTLTVKPRPIIDKMENESWKLYINEKPVLLTLDQVSEGVFDISFSTSTFESDKLSLKLLIGESIVGYGQIGIIKTTDPLLIGFITDQHYYFQGIFPYKKYRQTMDKTIQQMNAHNPDIVFFNGDYDEDNQPLGNIQQDVKSLLAPVFIGHGNHEKDNQDVNKVYKYLSNSDSYFDFEIGDYYFMIIDGNELSKNGAHVNTLMSQSQIAWIDSKLSEHPDKTKVVVSEPAIRWRDSSSWASSDPSQANRLHQLFKKHQVAIVVQGDKHQFDSQLYDGVEYLTIPSTTRPFYGDPRAGYGLLWLENGNIQWKGMVETYEANLSDPHPPEKWSLKMVNDEIIPSGILPEHFYSSPTLEISSENDILTINSTNHMGLISDVPVKTNSGEIKLFQIPENGVMVEYSLL